MPSALASHGPLDGFSWPQTEAFSLRIAPPAARLVLRGDGAVAAAAGAAFGVAIPQTPLRAAAAAGRVALWLGPDEWLLMSEGEAPTLLAAMLEDALKQLPHSLVDVSQRQIGLQIEGANAARALNAGCPLDLSPAAFAVGAATRTMLAKAEIVLWRRGANAFHIDVWRSFADYAAKFLVEAAARAPR